MAILDLSTFIFTDETRIIIDTNIWLYLFHPSYTANPKAYNTTPYSNAYNKMLLNKSHILINILIISEYINAYMKRTHSTTPKLKVLEYDKKLRRSSIFRPFIKEIELTTSQILKNAEIIDLSLTKGQILTSIKDFSNGFIDFNDGVYMKQTIQNNTYLLTHDSDMKNNNYNILTSNPKLLGRRPKKS